MSAPVDWVPEVALAPDQAPEAVHEVALVEDQVNVEDCPETMVVGLAASDTVGTGGGGGEFDTVTSPEALALPPDPVQVREKILLAVSVPVDWVPEVALAPDHAPEALQEVALVEDQVSVEDCPLTMVVGSAASDTVGTVGVGEAIAVTSVFPQAVAPNATTTLTIKDLMRWPRRVPALVSTERESLKTPREQF